MIKERAVIPPLSAWVLSVKLDGSPSGPSEEAKSAMAFYEKVIKVKADVAAYLN